MTSHTIEKVRPGGTRVRITASLSIPFAGPVSWEISVSTCAPKKRSFIGVWSMDDYNWRRLKGPDRDAYVLEKQLAVCTMDEILEAKIKLWESLKPTI